MLGHLEAKSGIFKSAGRCFVVLASTGSLRGLGVFLTPALPDNHSFGGLVLASSRTMRAFRWSTVSIRDAPMATLSPFNCALPETNEIIVAGVVLKLITGAPENPKLTSHNSTKKPLCWLFKSQDRRIVARSSSGGPKLTIATGAPLRLAEAARGKGVRSGTADAGVNCKSATSYRRRSISPLAR